MKKALTVALLIAVLAQILPFDALATIGKVLSAEELARAYALTGLGAGGLAANGDGAYHGGMKPNNSWNASQLRDWLDEKLNEDMNTVTDVLSQAAYTMAELKQTKPEAYARLAEGDSLQSAQEVYIEAERLREELRYYKDKLSEDTGVIAEYSRLLKEQDEDLFDSDKVRYSACIEDAAKDIAEIRQVIAEKSADWEAHIGRLSTFLEFGPSSEGSDPEEWKWMIDVLASNGGPVTNTAPVTRVSPSASRANRLASAAGTAANVVDASITVVSENDVAFTLQSGTKDRPVPVAGAKVKVRDILKENGEPETLTTDNNGTISIPVNKLSMDQFEVVHLYIEADLRPQGYRDFIIEDLDLVKGDIYTLTVTPLSGTSANGGAANAADDPYPYMMSFNSKDIMNSKYDMIYSTTNDYEFDIRVAMRNTAGKNLPNLVMRYYGNEGAASTGQYYYVEATKREGDVYTFRGKWKQKIAPNPREGGKNRTAVTFMFGKDAPANLTFPSQLVSHRSAVDDPIDEGTGNPSVFQEVLGKGFGFGFTIPDIHLTVGLNVPFQQYLPRIVINPGGYVNIFIGSSIFDDDANKLNSFWKSKDMVFYKQAEAWLQKKGWFANYKSKFNLAREYYKTQGFKFLRDCKIDIGMFALATGRWELDQAVPDVKATDVALKLVFGVTTTFNYSWTIPWTFLAVPMYLAFTFGVSVGFAMTFSLKFCWVNGHFQNWELKPYEDLTVFVGLSIAVRFGLGLKGILDAWVEISAMLNLIIRLNLSGQAPTAVAVEGNVRLSAGATLFFISVRKDWPLVGGRIYPRENAANLLDYYMNVEEAADKRVQVTPGEPQSYPQLAKEARELIYSSGQDNTGLNFKVLQVDHKTFAFRLLKVKGKDGKAHSRVSWQCLNPDRGVNGTGSVQTALDDDDLRKTEEGQWITKAIVDMDDYAFDVAADGRYVFIVATTARSFDADGFPVRNNLQDMSDDYNYNKNMAAYMLVLVSDDEGRLTHRAVREMKNGNYTNFTFDANSVSGSLDSYAIHSYDSFTNPRIDYARHHWNGITYDYFEVYGEMSTIAYRDDKSQAGATTFVYQGDRLYFLTDMRVMSSMGTGYERTRLQTTMMNVKGKVTPDALEWGYSMGFVALSQPKDGAEGDRAIELLDYDFNNTEGPQQVTSIVLDRGDIDNLELLVPHLDRSVTDLSNIERRLFYTKKEKNKAGVEQTRLYGMVIAPTQGLGTENLEIDVTKYVYDVTVPTNHFDIRVINNTTFLYGVYTAPKQNDSDPVIWRVWGMTFDEKTNTVTDPFVIAEFKLPEIRYRATQGSGDADVRLSAALSNVILTEAGTGYLNAVATNYEDVIKDAALRPKAAPVSLLSFEEKLQPSMDLITAIPKALTVRAGDFEDMTLGLMNDGNVPIAAFDVSMYEVVDGREGDAPVMTAHINAVDPTKNRLVGAGGVAISNGKQVAYREEDYGLSSRRHDWVVDSETRAYKLHRNFANVELVSSDVTKPSNPQHVNVDVLMPGSLNAFSAAFKIPEGWKGAKNLRLKVTGVSVESNAMAAAANAAGLIPNDENPSATLEYVLNERTGRLELQMPAQPNGALANAIASGLYADSVALTTTDVMLDIHDIDVTHRIYNGLDGEQMLDITLRNFTANGEKLKLTCAVYADGSDEAEYLSLPLYESAMSNRKTQIITLPVNALVDDPSRHRYARVEVSVVDAEENAYANNEFDVLFDGVDPLRIVTQPEDVTVQAGEDVAFTVEVGGGVQPYSYQWQIWDPVHGKWVDLKGFTEPVLRREDVEKKWNGCRFRCVVTDAEGTQIISQEVTLTVRDGVDTGDRSNLPLYLAVALAALALLWWLRRRREGVRD